MFEASTPARIVHGSSRSTFSRGVDSEGLGLLAAAGWYCEVPSGRGSEQMLGQDGLIQSRWHWSGRPSLRLVAVLSANSGGARDEDRKDSG